MRSETISSIPGRHTGRLTGSALLRYEVTLVVSVTAVLNTSLGRRTSLSLLDALVSAILAALLALCNEPSEYQSIEEACKREHSEQSSTHCKHSSPS